MPKDEIKISSNGVLTQLNFKPKLNSNDTTIDILLSDMMDNVSDTLNLNFFIAEDMELMDYGNFPNPFNPETTIRYGLPVTTDVSVVIYDLQGRMIRTYSESGHAAGWVNIHWDGSNASGEKGSTGVYLCRMVAGDYSRTIKMVYMK